MSNDTVEIEDEKHDQTGEEKVAKEFAEAEAKEKAEAEKTEYKRKLEELEAEKKKAEDIARQKSGALEEERAERKAAEAAAKALAKSKDVSEEELDQRLESKLNAREFTQRLKEVSQDTDEQALIKHHYETSIVKTGNVETDLARAVAIANSHLVDQAKQAQLEREEQEARVTGFQGGSPTGRKGKPVYETDPVLRGAASLLDRLGMGSSKKYLGK